MASNKAKSSDGVRTDRQVELLDKLEVIFLEEGFRRLTIGELASRLKCSKRTIYELAPSKQELVLLVMDRWLMRIRSMGRAGMLKHTDPVDRIEAYLEPGVSESIRAGSQFLADVQSSPPAHSILELHQRERTQVLRDILDDGKTRGRFRAFHSALVAEVFLASVARINEPSVLGAANLGFSEAFSEFFGLILHGIVDESKSPPN